MGISGIAGSSMYASVSTLKSFQQLNRDVDSQGVAQASRISKAAGDYSRVSNFGSETKIGTSKFQQANEQVSAKFAAVASAYKQAASLGSVSRGATVDIGA